jgi:phage/plasmid-associated DNA primase
VIEVSDSRRQDIVYFKGLWAEWSAGGAEAFLAFLLARDISDFDARTPLATTAKGIVASATADSVVRFLEEALVEGSGLLSANRCWQSEPIWLSKAEIYSGYKRWASETRQTYVLGQAEFLKRAAELLKLGPPKRNRVDGRQLECLQFASQPVCRTVLDDALSGTARAGGDAPVLI